MREAGAKAAAETRMARIRSAHAEAASHRADLIHRRRVNQTLAHNSQPPSLPARVGEMLLVLCCLLVVFLPIITLSSSSRCEECSQQYNLPFVAMDEDVTAKNTCIAVNHEDEFISKEIKETGRYGHARFFATIFLRLPELTFVDCGANIGFHTVQAAALGIHVIAFEPHPRNIELLRASVHCDGGDHHHVHLIKRALTNTPSEETLVLKSHAKSPGFSTLADSSNVKWKLGGHGKEYHVGLTTLDMSLRASCDFLASRNVSLMKVDVEGFEARALEGGSLFLHGQLQCGDRLIPPPHFVHIEIFPALLSAADSTPTKPLELLLAAGYDLFYNVGDGKGGGIVESSSSPINIPPDGVDTFVSSIREMSHVDVFGQHHLYVPPLGLDIRRGAFDSL